MSTSEGLKALANRSIDVHADELTGLAQRVLHMPELGFKEHRTSALVREAFDRMALPHRDRIAITGTRAEILCGTPGPTVAVLGELDSLICWEHADRDPVTGAVHACGHNAQIATMVGVGMALQAVASQLCGRISLMAVPAEEYVEIEERLRMRHAGAIEFLGGKAEFVRLGEFDDVDIAMMVHTTTLQSDRQLAVGGTSNGMVAKYVRYLGRASHAGMAPHSGINALYAAHVAIAGINAIRETFRDEDHIRVHPILTRGGDVVNAIPADVRIEMFCRGATTRAIDHAQRSVDRALKAGALAVGADVEITTLPGYLPLSHDANLVRLFRANAEAVVGAENVAERGHGGGSTDMGDLSHLLPTVHPYAAGAEGSGHGADFRIQDYKLAVLNPARALAMTVIDLLTDDAREANRVVSEYTPSLTRESYLAQLRRLTAERRWSASDLDS